mgnify:CR=1 FL=1
MEKSIADIMSCEVITLSSTASMYELHQLMKEHNIRHVPIVDDNKFAGVVTQKSVLAKVMYLLDLHGASNLSKEEKSINVMNLVDKNVVFANASMPLKDAAQFFVTNRHGCLPVVNNDNQLQGIVTSSDFVRLALKLLQ